MFCKLTLWNIWLFCFFLFIKLSYSCYSGTSTWFWFYWILFYLQAWERLLSGLNVTSSFSRFIWMLPTMLITFGGFRVGLVVKQYRKNQFSETIIFRSIWKKSHILNIRLRFQSSSCFCGTEKLKNKRTIKILKIICISFFKKVRLWSKDYRYAIFMCFL